MRLDNLKVGSTITLTGFISRNNEIRSDTGAFIKLMHDNHRFILVESAL